MELVTHAEKKSIYRKHLPITNIDWAFIFSLPSCAIGIEPDCQCRRRKRHWFNPWVGKIPSRRKWQPTPVFLSREYRGQRSLVGYSPWGCKESDTTEQLTLHAMLSFLPYFITGSSATGNQKEIIMSWQPFIRNNDLWSKFPQLILLLPSVNLRLREEKTPRNNYLWNTVIHYHGSNFRP